jgi:GDP-L-fucose synthase
MKILITGANGYIGKSLYNALKDKHEITSITRQNFDLTNIQSMIEFFKDKYFDIVLHCAIAGGSRLKEDEWEVMNTNLSIYYNLLQCRTYYNKLINFGSGAETHAADAPYGLSKLVIRNSIINIPNFYNVRIFGVFDENELDTRFIKANIKRYIDKEPIQIHQNKLMDFFYMKDLVNIIKYYINNGGPKEIDCKYKKTFSLKQIADIINSLDGHKVNIENINTDLKDNYVGEFRDLGIEFIGLEQGIKEVYNKLKNNT